MEWDENIWLTGIEWNGDVPISEPMILYRDGKKINW
jgi:hypothetical protein